MNKLHPQCIDLRDLNIIKLLVLKHIFSTIIWVRIVYDKHNEAVHSPVQHDDI